jgi:hypothetical protein
VPLRPQIEALGRKHVDYIANFNDLDAHWPAMADLIAPRTRSSNREPPSENWF